MINTFVALLRTTTVAVAGFVDAVVVVVAVEVITNRLSCKEHHRGSMIYDTIRYDTKGIREDYIEIDE